MGGNVPAPVVAVPTLSTPADTLPAVQEGGLAVALPENDRYAQTFGSGAFQLLDLDTLNGALHARAPAADLSLPATALVSRGRAVGLQQYTPPILPAPSVQFGATIVQNTADTRYTTRAFQGLPQIVRCGARLWVIYYGIKTVVTIGEDPGTFAIAAFSDDNGATWTEAFYIAYPDLTLRVWDLSVKYINGRLLILYTASGGNTYCDGYESVWSVWLNNPLGKKGLFCFSDHRYVGLGLPYNFFDVHGEPWVSIGYYDSSVTLCKVPNLAGRFAYRLNDRENTFERVIQVPILEALNKVTFAEFQYVPLRDGTSMLAQWRTFDGIYQTLSPDLGKSWGAGAPFTGVTNTKVVSKHYLGRSPSGRLVMVYNKNATNTRNNATIALSEDEGQTWIGEYTFFAGTSSYFTVDYDGAGTIYIAFDNNRLVSNGTAYVRLSKIVEDSLLATPNVTTTIVNQQG